MRFLNALERRYGHLAIPNLTYYLVGGQLLIYILMTANPLQFGQRFFLSGSLVAKGEWWRLITFLFEPLSMQPIFMVLTLYIMYTFGTVLEQVWGPFRYLCYIIMGYISAVLLSFLFPHTVITNSYLYSTVFLAFAMINPEYLIYIFFILPVKVKWLAWFTWITLLANFIAAGLDGKIILIGSLTNYLIFFGQDILSGITQKKRLLPGTIRSKVSPETTYLRCTICRATELDRKIFYYCKDCHPELCFCEDHVKNHTHKVIH